MELNHLLGGFAIAVGLLCLVAHLAATLGWKFPLTFRKLEPMRQRLGFWPGTIIHLAAYVVAPIVFGVIILTGGRV